MLEKIRNNIALVIGGFTIVGAVVGGINTVGRLVDTLSGIDDRVSQLEQLVADNEIQNQISILYEKIYQLEQVAYNVDYYSNLLKLDQKVMYLEWKVDDFQNRYISDLNNPSQDSQEYSLQKWEWQDMLKQIERMKTQVENVNQNWWQVDENTNQIQQLWQQTHGH